MPKDWDFFRLEEEETTHFLFIFVAFTILSNIKPWTEDILIFLVTLKEKCPSSFLAS